MVPSAAQPGQETVLIIGGGVIAIACAHYLTNAGYKVTVIEQGSVAGACSHANCGYICPSHILPLAAPGSIRSALLSLFNPSAAFRVKLQLNPAFLSWMWQFSLRCNMKKMLESAQHLKAILDSSASAYRTLLREDDMACQWQETGLLYVLKTARGMRDFARTDALLTDHFGVAARRMEGTELTEFDPALQTGLAGAFHFEDDSSLRPDQLARSWTTKLAKAGVKFIENCRFETLEKRGGLVKHVETSNGIMQADHYVLASGALSAKLARHFGAAIPVEPGKGYSITMDRPEDCPAHPMLLPEHHVGITPFDDGLRLGSMMEFVGFDRSLPESRLRLLQQSAKPYLRSDLPAGYPEPWYGWRPMTWDSLPIIGRIPGLNNAFLATGHNMLGLTLAPATGKLIAEVIQGIQPHIDPEPFSPTRFQ